MNAPHDSPTPTEAELAAARTAFARLGGSVKSERKAASSRANGKKGGWPKGRPRKPKAPPEA